VTRTARGETAILVTAVVLGMAPWFSATVTARAMVREWGGGDPLWLTLAVQFGFVAGSVASAALLLADRWSPRRLAAGSALVAAIATGALAVPGISSWTALACRWVVGVALAGVYPPGIKIAAGWTTTRRGLAIGVLVAGTSLGSAIPHLLSIVVAPDDWRSLQLLAATSAAAGALLFALRVTEGPHQARSAPFDPAALGRVFRHRQVMLATGGYLGHMWELYAMWSSIGLFFGAVASERAWSQPVVAMLSFATIAAGGIGCVWAGAVADRLGRSRTTIIAMATSGLCAIAIGPLMHGPAVVLVAVALLWGVSIVADSAQFSAAVTEWSDGAYVGTSVTVQTALGFLLTMVTIRLVPTWSAAWGWTWAYMPLALGPALGIVAMARLARDESRKRALTATHNA
jgi:MFS family permease